MNPKPFLSVAQTKFLSEYFPGEAITNRLINWLYIVLKLKDEKYTLPNTRDFLIYPRFLVDDLRKNRIFPEWVREHRCAGMFAKEKFSWFEESEIFYRTFLVGINDQGFKVTWPLALNSRRVEECIMLFDGIVGDRDTKELFLLNARKKWEDFRPIIGTLAWVKKGDVERNIAAVNSSFEYVGCFKPSVNKYFELNDQYLDFMVYFFSIDLGFQTIKKLSAHAKKIIAQSRPRRSKDKGQINVLLAEPTIDRLEKICGIRGLSKAKMITLLIHNYYEFKKEIDAAVARAEMEILKEKFAGLPEIHQLISPENTIQSDIPIRKLVGRSDEIKSAPIGYSNISNQQPTEIVVPQGGYSGFNNCLDEDKK